MALCLGRGAPTTQRLSDRTLQGGVRVPRFGIVVVAHGGTIHTIVQELTGIEDVPHVSN